MAINFYAGLIENNTVNAFYPVNIVKASEITMQNINGFNLHNGGYTTLDKLDETPIDWIDVFLSCYGYTRDTVVWDNIIGKEINFFLEENIESKLNFKMMCYSETEFYFGDFVRGIKMFIQISDISYYNCYCISNPRYLTDSFDNLLNNSKDFLFNIFNVGSYNIFTNFVDYKLFSFYNKHIERANITIIPNSASYETATVNRYNLNLSNWNNWYTMITGKHYNGEPFYYELANPIGDIDRIEFSVPIIFTSQYFDEGKTTLIEEKNTTSFNFMEVGTDLVYLFSLNNNEPIIFKTGQITTISGRTVMSLILNDEGIQVRTASRNLNPFYDSYNLGRMSNLSCYLSIPWNFATQDQRLWASLISSDYSKWEYPNAPLFFITNGVGILNTNAPTNYFENINSEIPVYVSEQYQTLYYNDYPISYEFWDGLLTGNIPSRPPLVIGGGSIGGGDSIIGGGQGGFDDSNDEIEIGDLPNGVVDISSLCSLYNVTEYNLEVIGEWLNTKDWISEAFKSPTNYISKLQGIVSMKQIYCPSNSHIIPIISSEVKIENIILGGDNTGANGFVIPKQFISGSLGTFSFKEYFGNFLDYNPYTKIEIYLPFVGTKEIYSDIVMNKKIELLYRIDILSGLIVYLLKIENSVLYEWNGNCSFEIPLIASDYSGKIQSAISLLTAPVNTFMAFSSGNLGAITNTTINFASNATTLLNNKTQIEKSGNIGNTAGVMNVLYPYIAITRPKMSHPSNYGHTKGYPSNISTILGVLKGYTVIGDIHLENMGFAISEELDEIESLLKSGVIF